MLDMKMKVKSLVSIHRQHYLKQHLWQDMKFQQKKTNPKTKEILQSGSIVLGWLYVCQVPTKMLSHSQPQQDR